MIGWITTTILLTDSSPIFLPLLDINLSAIWQAVAFKVTGERSFRESNIAMAMERQQISGDEVKRANEWWRLLRVSDGISSRQQEDNILFFCFILLSSGLDRIYISWRDGAVRMASPMLYLVAGQVQGRVSEIIPGNHSRNAGQSASDTSHVSSSCLWMFKSNGIILFLSVWGFKRWQTFLAKSFQRCLLESASSALDLNLPFGNDATDQGLYAVHYRTNILHSSRRVINIFLYKRELWWFWSSWILRQTNRWNIP